MKQFDKDLQASIEWLVDIALDVTREAIKRQNNVDKVFALGAVVAECAALPGDGPLRIRCTPHVFSFKA